MHARSLLTLILLLSCSWSMAQRTITGTVVDKKTGEAIPSVSVNLILEKAGTSADDKGQFKLDYSKQLPYDTLQFRAIGYTPFKILLKAFKSGSRINLEENVKILREVKIGGNFNEVILGKMPGYSIGKSHILRGGAQFAKKFEMPTDRSWLRNILIRRLPKQLGSDSKTRFLIAVYEVDQRKGGPGKIMHPGKIEVQDDDNALIAVDLKKYNIHILEKHFFVAIETIISPYNERYDLVRITNDTDQGMAPASFEVNYHPVIYGQPTGFKNTWMKGLKSNSKWIFTQYDISLQVTVL